MSTVCNPSLNAKRMLDMGHLSLPHGLELRWRSASLQAGFHFKIPLPDGEDRWIDDQLHQKRGDNSTDHRSRNALHHITTRPNRPHDWQQSEQHAGHCHDFWTETLHGADDNGFAKIIPTTHLALLDSVVVGKIQIQQHEYCRLSINSQ